MSSREGGLPLLGAGGFATRDSSISGHSDFSVSSSPFHSILFFFFMGDKERQSTGELGW